MIRDRQAIPIDLRRSGFASVPWELARIRQRFFLHRMELWERFCGSYVQLLDNAMRAELSRRLQLAQVVRHLEWVTLNSNQSRINGNLRELFHVMAGGGIPSSFK